MVPHEVTRDRLSSRCFSFRRKHAETRVYTSDDLSGSKVGTAELRHEAMCQKYLINELKLQVGTVLRPQWGR